MGYVWRDGRRIETVSSCKVPKKKSMPFEIKWAKFPKRWEVALRQTKKVSTYQLALAILFQASKNRANKYERDEKIITLSLAVTGMSRNNRMRAARELVKFGLIEVEQRGREAMRVSPKHIPT